MDSVLLNLLKRCGSGRVPGQVITDTVMRSKIYLEKPRPYRDATCSKEVVQFTRMAGFA